MINKDLSNKEYHEHASYSSSDVKAVATSTIYHWKNAVNSSRVSLATRSKGVVLHAL